MIPVRKKHSLPSALRRRLRQAGNGMADFIMAAAVMGAMTVAGVSMVDSNHKDNEAMQAGDHFAERIEFARTYVKDNFEQLYAAAAAGPQLVDMDDLPAQYQPPKGMGINRFGQDYVLVARRVGDGLQMMVATRGGKEIKSNEASEAAQRVGTHGGVYAGYVPHGTSVLALSDGRQIDLGGWGLSALPGRLASVETVVRERGEGDFLFRFQAPGLPNANTMETTLSMGGNDIVSGHLVTAQKLSASGNVIDDQDMTVKGNAEVRDKVGTWGQAKTTQATARNNVVINGVTFTEDLAKDAKMLTSSKCPPGAIVVNEPGKGLTCNKDLPDGVVIAINDMVCPAGWSPMMETGGRTIVGQGSKYAFTEIGGSQTKTITYGEMPGGVQSYQSPSEVHAQHGSNGCRTCHHIKFSEAAPLNVMMPYVALTHCVRDGGNGGGNGASSGGNSAPVWVTESLPNASANYEYAAVIQANDPDGESVKYSLVKGLLPPGVTLTNNVLMGTARTPIEGETTDYPFTLRATDGHEAFTDKQFVVTVTPNQPPQWSNTSVADAIRNRHYDQDLAVSDPEHQPFTVIVQDPQHLPPGIALVGNDKVGYSLTGTPSVSGVYSFTLLAEDNKHSQSTRQITLAVEDAMVWSKTNEWTTTQASIGGLVACSYNQGQSCSTKNQSVNCYSSKSANQGSWSVNMQTWKCLPE